MSGKLIQGAVSIMIPGFYRYLGQGVGALTPTIDIARYRGTTWASVIAGGSASAATGCTGGYGYLLDSSHIQAGDLFMGKFITSGTVDAKELPFMFRVEDNYTVAKVAETSPAAIRAAVGLAAANLDTQLDGLPTNAELTAAVLVGSTSVNDTQNANFTGLDQDLTQMEGNLNDAIVNVAPYVWTQPTADMVTPATMGAFVVAIPDVADLAAAVAPLALEVTVAAGLDVPVSTRAAPADLAPLALEATVAAGLDVPVSTRATVAGVWAELLADITTEGSIGKLIKDNLNAAVSTLPALIAAALRAVVVTFRGPVESPRLIFIRAGDDYTNDVYPRAFPWQFKNLPELVGGTASLVVDGIELAADGTVTDGGVDGDGNTLQNVTIEVPAASSSLLLAANYGRRKPFSMRVTKSGEFFTEVSGTATVAPPHI